MLKGKNAVVTGSTSGIGIAIADALAESGANVMLNGLGSRVENSKAIAQVADYGTKVLFSPANMLQPKQIADMMETAETELGSIDILINNAGIQHVSPIEEFPIEKWDAIIAINLTAAFHTIRLAVSGMKRRKWGRIINTASAHSLVASPYKSAYVSAKHALAGLTKTVALETAEFGITCNCVSPGYVWTPLVENQLEDTAKARNISTDEVKTNVMLAGQPTREFVTVEQVGALTVFLCSEHAANITGANFSIDGGWTAQ